MDTDTTEAEKVLYENIDPGSLDTLFKRKHDGRGRSNGHVTFTVNGHVVRVTAEGRIEISSHPRSYE